MSADVQGGRLRLVGGRLIDPAEEIDDSADIVVEDGRVVEVVRSGQRERAGRSADAAQTIDLAGLIVAPGFVDLHCHLREPGFEYKETIETGTRAAAAGGFTTICAMADTRPTTDTG